MDWNSLFLNPIQLIAKLISPMLCDPVLGKRPSVPCSFFAQAPDKTNFSNAPWSIFLLQTSAFE